MNTSNPSISDLDVFASFLQFIDENISKQVCDSLWREPSKRCRFWKLYQSTENRRGPNSLLFLGRIESFYLPIFFDWYKEKAKVCPGEEFIIHNCFFFFQTLNEVFCEDMVDQIYQYDPKQETKGHE